MARVQLTPLASYPFAAKLVVRTTDLNYGGHLGNDRVLTLVHEARVAWLASHGWTELACGGVSLIMADAAIVYRNEAFAGDRLRIEVAPTAPTGTAFRLAYRVTRPSDETEIALVETGMVCYDYERRRIVRLPAAVRSACNADTNGTTDP